MIKWEKVSKVYPMGARQLTVLKEIDLQIGKGEFIIILGPSGSGKSTLLNILGFMDTHSSGEFYIDGKEVKNLTFSEMAKYRNQKVGFVFQSFFLMKEMKAWENVSLPLGYAGVKTKERKKRSIEALKKVGLSERVNNLPSELSGGEQQRVAIARAIINQPDIIIADEPTGNLDSQTTLEIMELLKQLYQDGKTIIMSTHNESLLPYATRIIRIRDGEVLEEGGIS